MQVKAELEKIRQADRVRRIARYRKYIQDKFWLHVERILPDRDWTNFEDGTNLERIRQEIYEVAKLRPLSEIYSLEGTSHRQILQLIKSVISYCEKTTKGQDCIYFCGGSYNGIPESKVVSTGQYKFDPTKLAGLDLEKFIEEIESIDVSKEMSNSILSTFHCNETSYTVVNIVCRFGFMKI